MALKPRASRVTSISKSVRFELQLGISDLGFKTRSLRSQSCHELQEYHGQERKERDKRDSVRIIWTNPYPGKLRRQEEKSLSKFTIREKSE